MSSFEPKSGVAPSLATYTGADLIVPELQQRDTPGIISELSLLLQRRGSIPDVLPFYHSALNQELLASSTLECGFALPHARLSGVRQLQFALGRVPKPIIWASKWSWPVQFVFLLAVPATDAAAYLHLLGTLARLGQDRQRLAQLREAATREEMFHILDSVPTRNGSAFAVGSGTTNGPSVPGQSILSSGT